ncbi:hypothetical protein [Flavobacterium lipolyticum]|uniref:Uncharacterized protein n=1 Tax=Flavobacterium lipolyticum TaxID=2893754 RepID=A0ABS8M3S3_9FLAO|nr:hypothetical protein [Flavobacterium sp. F-126]MCC9019402.1 hypothetical protein [Flavobacterium sp. F-126]
MGTYAHIIKNWEKHDPEKVFMDAANICFNINAMFYFHNDKTFYVDGKLKHTYVGVIDDKISVSEDINNQFILNIQGVNKDDIVMGLDKDLDYLVPNEKLCSLVYIEKVRDENTELIFRFAYEYLKLNPDEYFWFEWEYAFSWTDMMRLNKIPFNKNWCFTNPKDLM